MLRELLRIRLWDWNYLGLLKLKLLLLLHLQDLRWLELLHRWLLQGLPTNLWVELKLSILLLDRTLLRGLARLIILSAISLAIGLLYLLSFLVLLLLWLLEHRLLRLLFYS